MDWTLRRLFDEAGIPADVRGDARVTGMSHVSSEVARGDLFCCIVGEKFDGHDFAADAVAAGASALLVERTLPLDVPQARVSGGRHAIGPLASIFYGRPSSTLRIAAITGTNGKTTTTYLVESIAIAAGTRGGVIGTIECRVGDRTFPKRGVGTPEGIELHRMLAAMVFGDAASGDADVIGMEVTSQALAKGRVDGTAFACAAFTNLTADHDEWHGSMEAYFEAKSLLFDGRFAPRAVVNIDDPYGERLAARIGDVLWTCSSRGRASDIAAEAVELRDDGFTATLRTPLGTAEISSTLVGRYNVDNVLSAAGSALAVGLPLDAVVAGVRDVPKLQGRLERIEEGQAFRLLVDYAHTPDALDNVLRAAREFASGRVIVVFGCGGDRDRGKRPVMGEIATRTADIAIVTSDNPRSEDPDAIIADVVAGASRGGGDFAVEPDRRAAIARAIDLAAPGDAVLIAGKGHEQGQTIGSTVIPFDDREVARELLRELKCRS